MLLTVTAIGLRRLRVSPRSHRSSRMTHGASCPVDSTTAALGGLNAITAINGITVLCHLVTLLTRPLALVHQSTASQVAVFGRGPRAAQYPGTIERRHTLHVEAAAVGCSPLTQA